MRAWAVAAALAVAIAAVALIVAAGGPGGPSEQHCRKLSLAQVLRDARRSGPALPPSGRLFGFDDETFAFRGARARGLDQGVTAQRELADARAAGANSARIAVSWSAVEPRRRAFRSAYIARLKAFTKRIEATGGRVLLVLGDPPAWASAKPGDPDATIRNSPRVVRAYARFAGRVARAWPHAAGIETWSEPNTVRHWRPRSPDPRLYVRMHKAAAAAIRAAVPGMRVIFAGLLDFPRSSPRLLTPRAFLSRAYAAGLRPGDYDALGYHGYPAQEYGQIAPLSTTFADIYAGFRAAYRSADPNARVWITETGASTTGAPHSGVPLAGHEQACALLALIRRFLDDRRVDAVYVHALYDATRFPSTSIGRGYGVLEARGARPARPKPAFCVLRALARNRRPVSGCPG